jgi:hypothetical protein
MAIPEHTPFIQLIIVPKGALYTPLNQPADRDDYLVGLGRDGELYIWSPFSMSWVQDHSREAV